MFLIFVLICFVLNTDFLNEFILMLNLIIYSETLVTVLLKYLS